MPEQRNIDQMGASMRLGLYPCKLLPGSLAHKAYGQRVVYERHRHRFEFNNEYRESLGDAGMVFSGVSPNGRLVEIVELTDHPWFVATQFHPEFRSRPNRAHPPFLPFVRAGETGVWGAVLLVWGPGRGGWCGPGGSWGQRGGPLAPPGAFRVVATRN